MENVITVIFPVETEAYKAFSEIRHDMLNPSCIIPQLVLVRKNEGKITACDSANSGVTVGDDTAAGGLIGMLAGIIGGPLGVILGAAAGSLAGMAVDSVDAAREVSLIEQVCTKLLDGDTALIALAQESDEKVFDAKLSGYQTTIIRHDAAVVAAEVERALEVQAELAREAKRKMREAKKEEFSQAIAKKKAEFKAKFEEIKSKITGKKEELKAKAEEVKAQAEELRDEAIAKGEELKAKADEVKAQAEELRDKAIAKGEELKAKADEMKSHLTGKA